ncbi:hypothetical protein PDJAM_G00044360 [Pangasius djambal]|uniref:Uncharacterized protein n=1 Tax=Pangasius djambal TaxID=1691987 RepID=A0ACC5YTW0_9TELE|nr:hypothetical protein [Pangasius djambal]
MFSRLSLCLRPKTLTTTHISALHRWNIVADEATSPAIRSSSKSSSLSFLRRRCPASSADKGALRFRSMDS